MERIKRAAEKRRAWLEVSTNNVYFIHPNLLTLLRLHPSPRNPYPFRTRPQWPISKVDRKRGSFFFFTRWVGIRVSVHRWNGRCACVWTRVEDDMCKRWNFCLDSLLSGSRWPPMLLRSCDKIKTYTSHSIQKKSYDVSQKKKSNNLMNSNLIMRII